MSIWQSIKRFICHDAGGTFDSPDALVCAMRASPDNRYAVPVEQAFWVAARHLRAADLIDEHLHRVTHIVFDPRAKKRWTASLTRIVVQVDENDALLLSYPTDLIRAWATAMLYAAGYKQEVHERLMSKAGI